jgi:hypothetical protein
VVDGATTTHIKNWDKHEKKAKAFLCMSVKDNIIPHIKKLILLLKCGQHLKPCMKLATEIIFCS